MYEVASRPIRTKTPRMIRPTQFSFVLWMARKTTQLNYAMCELTLVTVFAISILLEGSAQLGLVSVGSSGSLLKTRAILFFTSRSLLQSGAIGKGSWAHSVRDGSKLCGRRTRRKHLYTEKRKIKAGIRNTIVTVCPFL